MSDRTASGIEWLFAGVRVGLGTLACGTTLWLVGWPHDHLGILMWGMGCFLCGEFVSGIGK